MEGASSKKENYRVTVLDSYLTTKREKLTVIPYIKPYYSEGYDATKIYDGNAPADLEGFYTSYVVSGNFVNDETISDVLPQNAHLLTLQEDGKYVKILSSGEVLADEMKDCGKYKIMLDKSVAVNVGMEHYELCFDSSKTYYYEILQKEIHIVLDSAESVEVEGKSYPVVYKKYGQSDPVFRFKTVETLTENVNANLDELKDLERASLGVVRPGEEVAYVPHTDAHFINTAKSLHGADSLLDVAIFDVKTDVEGIKTDVKGIIKY